MAAMLEAQDNIDESQLMSQINQIVDAKKLNFLDLDYESNIDVRIEDND